MTIEQQEVSRILEIAKDYVNDPSVRPWIQDLYLAAKTLATENAPLVRERDELREHLQFAVNDTDARLSVVDSRIDDTVYDLCEKNGYGAVMDSAARQWQKKDGYGAFYIGGCIALARKALAAPQATAAEVE